MALEKLFIPATPKTPEINLRPEGEIWIKGRDFRTGIEKFQEEVDAWIAEYIKKPAEVTRVSIAFEYLNSVSTKVIKDMLKNITMVQLQGKQLTILWYYEADDIDIYEKGSYISDTLNAKFEFLSVEQIRKVEI